MTLPWGGEKGSMLLIAGMWTIEGEVGEEAN